MEAYAFENLLDHYTTLEQMSCIAYMKTKSVRVQGSDGEMYDDEILEYDEKRAPLKKIYTLSTDNLILGMTGGHVVVLSKGDKVEILGTKTSGNGTSFNILFSKFKPGSLSYRHGKRFAHVQTMIAGTSG